MTSVKLSEIISPGFFDLYLRIKNENPDEVILKGGRGSCKSSFCGIMAVKFIVENPECHGAIYRKVGSTVRNSAYAQIKKAIRLLGLTQKFKCTVSPMEITYKATGQKIFFSGLDDPDKARSITPDFGYIGFMWLEEANQFNGENEVRDLRQSVLRGGEKSILYMSYNPPAASRNWVNKYALEKSKGKIVHHSTYLTTPRVWLGPGFFKLAEHVRKTKETKYKHEYLGEVVGNGTQVFDNLRFEKISKAKINTFNNIVSGVDWGWYPDPWAFNRTAYDPARRTLYIFKEDRRNKMYNNETAALVKKYIDVGETIIADSAEKKSIADYRKYGLKQCYPSVKRGGVAQGMKWLQSLEAIVIDPETCPHTVTEFSEYEYETTKDGEVMSGYVDSDNHHIDAVRYATNRIWLKAGA